MMINMEEANDQYGRRRKHQDNVRQTHQAEPKKSLSLHYEFEDTTHIPGRSSRAKPFGNPKGVGGVMWAGGCRLGDWRKQKKLFGLGMDGSIWRLTNFTIRCCFWRTLFGAWLQGSAEFQTGKDGLDGPAKSIWPAWPDLLVSHGAAYPPAARRHRRAHALPKARLWLLWGMGVS